MRRLVMFATLITVPVAACKKDDKAAAPPAGSAIGSGAAASTAPSPTTAPAGSAAGSARPTLPTLPSMNPSSVKRPASVTDAQVAIADALVAETEAMAKDVAAAGTDCAKATMAIKAHAGKIGPAVEAAKPLKDQTENDPAAKQWFQTTYNPKIMAAAQIMAPTTQACLADAAFTAAAQGYMPGAKVKKSAAPPPTPAPTR